MSKVTDRQREALRKLGERPEREIDLSDVPEIRKIPKDAAVGKFARPPQMRLTIRLDADVVAWLKTGGAGYQARINEYLREKMRERRPGRR
jgi:uncharacterized protein (DUF4415 family)